MAKVISKSLLRYSVDGIITFDCNLRVTFLNPAFENLVGLKKTEILHRPVNLILSTLSRNYGAGIYHQVLNGERVIVPENKYSTREGYFEGQLMPLMNDAGDVIGGLCIIYDITDRKLAEEYIKKKNLRLEQSIHELKQFTYIVSHDLKAPLRAISSLSTWLEKDHAQELNDEGRSLLEYIRKRVLRMNSFIDALLTYSHTGTREDQKEELEVKALVDEVICAVAPPSKVSVKADGKLPKVRYERPKLYQVLHCLIDNAVKFNDKEAGQVEVLLVNELPDEVTLAVRDNGVGIAEKYHSKVFRLFQTLSQRDETENTGVGLALVKKIIESNYGRIWVESEVGKGSTFYFTIPR